MARKTANLAAYRLAPENEDKVVKNVNLVHKVIEDKFSIYHEWYDDMFQEGIIGLIRAVARHKEGGAAQFSTYAYFCIKNEIQKFVSECTDTIRVPVSVGLAIHGIRTIEERGGTEEEKNTVLQHNQISMAMLNAGRTALATTYMDDTNEDGLPYRDILPDKLTLEEQMRNTTLEERELYSALHKWLNFNYPDDIHNNRVYINYIWLTDQGELKVSQIYKVLSDTYQVNRTIIRQIVKEYPEKVKDYFKGKVKY